MTVTTTVADVRAAVDAATAAGQAFEVAECELSGGTHRAFVHAPATLPNVLDALRGHGDTEFVVFEGDRWSFAEFFADADALAAAMQHEFGVRPGDRVAIAMRNCRDWLLVFAAAVEVGAVVVPANSWGSTEELDFTLRNAGVTLLAADLPRTELACSSITFVSATVLFSDVDGAPDQLSPQVTAAVRILTIDDAVSAGRDRPHDRPRVQPEDPALLLYTSGSTGFPKGVITRHVAVGQILMNMMLSGMVALSVAPTPDADPGPQTHLVTVPLFHATGLFGGFLLPGLLGHRIVLLRKWAAEPAMRVIEAERVTMLASVPAIFKDLLTHPRFNDYDCSSLTRTSLAGAATPADLPDLMHAKLGVVAKGSGWGMTESGAVGSTMSGPVFDLKPFSAGIRSPIIDVRTTDSEGRPLPPGSEGELQLRGITVTPGYWGSPDQTAAALTDDGWLRTGDVGLLDGDDFVEITGRIKEIVIRGGENISPIEIENAAYRHPAVKEAAVFGVTDSVLGEELAIVCHRQPGSTLGEVGLREHLSAALPKFKVPRYVEVTDTPLPRNASEKIHRLALRNAFADRSGVSGG